MQEVGTRDSERRQALERNGEVLDESMRILVRWTDVHWICQESPTEKDHNSNRQQEPSASSLPHNQSFKVIVKKQDHQVLENLRDQVNEVFPDTVEWIRRADKYLEKLCKLEEKAAKNFGQNLSHKDAHQLWVLVCERNKSRKLYAALTRQLPEVRVRKLPLRKEILQTKPLKPNILSEDNPKDIDSWMEEWEGWASRGADEFWAAMSSLGGSWAG